MQEKTSWNDEWRKIEGEELGHKSSPVKANDYRCYENANLTCVCIVPFLPTGTNNFYDLHSSSCNANFAIFILQRVVIYITMRNVIAVVKT